MTFNGALDRLIPPLVALANVTLLSFPLLIIMALDRIKGRWAGWRHYGLAFLIMVELYFLANVILYGGQNLGSKTIAALTILAIAAILLAYWRRHIRQHDA